MTEAGRRERERGSQDWAGGREGVMTEAGGRERESRPRLGGERERRSHD